MVKEAGRDGAPVAGGQVHGELHSYFMGTRYFMNARNYRSWRPRLRRSPTSAWGKTPDGIHWELGIRRNAAPLLTLIGDRYVSDS